MLLAMSRLQIRLFGPYFSYFGSMAAAMILQMN